jgi:hypothetical protein
MDHQDSQAEICQVDRRNRTTPLLQVILVPRSQATHLLRAILVPRNRRPLVIRARHMPNQVRTSRMKHTAKSLRRNKNMVTKNLNLAVLMALTTILNRATRMIPNMEKNPNTTNRKNPNMINLKNPNTINTINMTNTTNTVDMAIINMARLTGTICHLKTLV